MHKIFKMKNIVPLEMSQRNCDTKLGRLWHTISIKPKETKVLLNNHDIKADAHGKGCDSEDNESDN